MPSTLTDSQRAQSVQSPIIPVVAELIRRHPGTISLGQGVVHYGPPQQALEQIPLFLADPDNHKYRQVYGIPELRDRIARKLDVENHLNTDDAEIIVTAGSNMAFQSAILAIADPGDEIILQAPYYFNHEMAVTLAGCRPVFAETDSSYQLQPDVIEAAIGPRTKAIVTISPNNPTGAVYSEQALREVNSICAKRGIYHIHDEAYEYFTYDGVRAYSPGSAPGSAAHTVSLYSLSKAYGFASWRIGYMTVPKQLLVAVNKIQDTNLICPPVISQYAAIGALDAGRDYCESHLKGIAEVRRTAQEKMRELDGICSFPASDGAFYLLLKVKTNLGSMELVRRLVEEHRVAAIPGTAFGIHDACAIRVSYAALKSDTVTEGLGRLTEGLRSIVN